MTGESLVDLGEPYNLPRHPPPEPPIAAPVSPVIMVFAFTNQQLTNLIFAKFLRSCLVLKRIDCLFGCLELIVPATALLQKCRI